MDGLELLVPGFAKLLNQFQKSTMSQIAYTYRFHQSEIFSLNLSTTTKLLIHYCRHLNQGERTRMFSSTARSPCMVQ
jgi:hypothetical protein